MTTNDDKEKRLDMERAMVLMGIWGETQSVSEWNGYAYAEESWVPDGSDIPSEDRHDCVTVLEYGFGEIEAPEGYKVVLDWQAGEHSCPWCGDGTGDDDEGRSEEERRESCELCEGDGVIYQGEEARVVVFQLNFPSEDDVADALAAEAKDLEPAADDADEEDHYVDVRLQVYPDGQWALRVGDPSFDLDHHGWFGAGSLPRPSADAPFALCDARMLARDLLSNAKDSFYQSR